MDTADGVVNDESDNGGLPFVDEHTVIVAASRELVWTALHRYVVTSLCAGEGSAFTKILGTQPPSGFEISESRPFERLAIAGRHRFSHYRLVFHLRDASDGTTQVIAETFAAFPGVQGRIYRALVIGTRAHVVAVHHMLRSIRRLTIEVTAAGDPPT